MLLPFISLYLGGCSQLEKIELRPFNQSLPFILSSPSAFPSSIEMGQLLARNGDIIIFYTKTGFDLKVTLGADFKSKNETLRASIKAF